MKKAVPRLLRMPELDRLTVYLVAYFAVMFAGFFWLDTGMHRTVMYMGGITGLIAMGVCARGSAPIALTPDWSWWKGYLRQPLILAALVFLSYSTLSVLWSDPDNSARVIKFAKVGGILVLFAFLFVSTLRRYPRLYGVVISAFIVSAAISAAGVFVSSFVLVADIDTLRLNGFGRADNSVMVGLYYGLASLFLLLPDSEIWQRLRSPWIRYTMLAVMLVAFVCSFSRGPYLAFVLTLGSVLAQRRQYKALGAVVLCALIAAASLYWSDFSNSNFFERGSSGRLEIWVQALELIAQKPVFGHGVATKHIYNFHYLGASSQIGHAHSIYLSTLIQSGILGLMALLTVYFYAFKKAMAQLKRKRISPFLMLGMGAFLGLTDFGGFHINLGPEWLVFWLPAIILGTFYEDENASSQSAKI